MKTCQFRLRFGHRQGTSRHQSCTCTKDVECLSASFQYFAIRTSKRSLAVMYSRFTWWGICVRLFCDLMIETKFRKKQSAHTGCKKLGLFCNVVIERNFVTMYLRAPTMAKNALKTSAITKKKENFLPIICQYVMRDLPISHQSICISYLRICQCVVRNLVSDFMTAEWLHANASTCMRIAAWSCGSDFIPIHLCVHNFKNCLLIIWRWFRANTFENFVLSRLKDIHAFSRSASSVRL